jgi:hypothetical protein
MKKVLTVLCLVVIAGAFAGAAGAADSPSLPAATEIQAAALPALLDGALDCGAASTQALPLAGTTQTEAVVCCTAADRAACTQECAPLIGRTFCIHGCECYCF